MFIYIYIYIYIAEFIRKIQSVQFSVIYHTFVEYVNNSSSSIQRSINLLVWQYIAWLIYCKMLGENKYLHSNLLTCCKVKMINSLFQLLYYSLIDN